ncbi:hypothetical protein ACWGQQ_11180 [Bradyrhizobium sp. Lot33]
MSCGVGKGWRRWRNQAGQRAKLQRVADELKERFGKRPAQQPKKTIKSSIRN